MPCERPLQSSQSPQNLVHAPEGGALIASGFTARVGRAGGARTRGLVSSGRTLVECRLVLETLAETDGNRTASARLLGFSIRTLRNEITKYSADGVDVPPPGGLT